MRHVAALCVLTLTACSGQPTPTPTPRATPPATPPIATPPHSPVPKAIPAQPPPPAVAAILADISAPALHATVTRLAAFGTRHTLSATDSDTRGIGAARTWLHAELTRHAAHRLDPDGKRIDRPVDIINVLAELPGSLPAARARRYYVVGHYDARATDPMDATSDAPGANDDASVTTIPHGKDNQFFAVRAYDRDGYRSPAAFPGIADK